jgi:uncharacterized membrane protein YfcA
VTTAARDTVVAPFSPVRWAGMLGLGFFANFLDTLGVGSFATTTAAFKIGNLVDDRDIPGTLNVGHSIPTVLEALIYITVIKVELPTLVSMIAAGAFGAFFGARWVSGWSRLTIQRGLAIALLITAVIMSLRQLQFFPPGGDALGLTGVALIVAILANAVIGSLASLGIGNYAPCMAVVSLLGMSPTAAFPIMMGSAALILPAAASGFLASKRFDRRIAIALAIGGIPGVLVAAFIVKSLPLDTVRWLVIVVLTYTSFMMFRSAKAESAARVTA